MRRNEVVGEMKRIAVYCGSATPADARFMDLRASVLEFLHEKQGHKRLRAA